MSTSSRVFRKVRRAGRARHQNNYYINLILLVIFGVLVCAWLLYYTDWFEVVGGLLALGGAFAWLAFLLKIVKEDRIQEMQIWIDDILSKKGTLGCLLLLIFVSCLLTQLLGTIQVDLFKETIDREVSAYPFNGVKDHPMRLPAGRSVRIVLWTTWSGVRYVVKVSGYPDRSVLLYPLRRPELRIPTSFRREIVFVRPSVDTFEKTINTPQTVVLSVIHANGQKFGPKSSPIPYVGQTFWLGCDEDVEVPQVLQQQWFPELTNAKRIDLVNVWRHPTALFAAVTLEKGDQVKVQIQNDAGEVWSGSHAGFQDSQNLVTELIMYEER